MEHPVSLKKRRELLQNVSILPCHWFINLIFGRFETIEYFRERRGVKIGRDFPDRHVRWGCKSEFTSSPVTAFEPDKSWPFVGFSVSKMTHRRGANIARGERDDEFRQSTPSATGRKERARMSASAISQNTLERARKICIQRESIPRRVLQREKDSRRLVKPDVTSSRETESCPREFLVDRGRFSASSKMIHRVEWLIYQSLLFP